ncbi:hypothetical protein KR074_012291 [Drosophila pseudoananassae]|nr:hypothetical protein KR074_012291 [Drosophila pseudoananassae]
MFPNNFYKMKNFANPKTMFKSCSSANNNNDDKDEVATESLNDMAAQAGAGVVGAEIDAAAAAAAAAGGANAAPKEKNLNAKNAKNAAKVVIPSTPSTASSATPDKSNSNANTNTKHGKNKKNKLTKKLLKNQSAMPPPRTPSVSSEASVDSKDNSKLNNKTTAKPKDNNKIVPEKKVMMPEMAGQKKATLAVPPSPTKKMATTIIVTSQDISQEVAQAIDKEAIIIPKVETKDVAVQDDMMPIEMAEFDPPIDGVGDLGDMVPMQESCMMPVNEHHEPHHPLNSRWTLWYLENDRTKSWEDMLHEVTSFDTVENFWSLVNHIKPPSEIKMGSDYCLFKKGIRPMWEDEANVHGGRWVISLNKNTKSDLDNFWLDTMLCLIGESCEYSDELCGAVVNIRAKSNKISIWTADGGNEAAALEIGRKLREGLRMESAYVLQYQLHKDTMVKQGSTVKSIYTM